MHDTVCRKVRLHWVTLTDDERFLSRFKRLTFLEIFSNVFSHLWRYVNSLVPFCCRLRFSSLLFYPLWDVTCKPCVLQLCVFSRYFMILFANKHVTLRTNYYVSGLCLLLLFFKCFLRRGPWREHGTKLWDQWIDVETLPNDVLTRLCWSLYRITSWRYPRKIATSL